MILYQNANQKSIYVKHFAYRNGSERIYSSKPLISDQSSY